MTTNGKINLRAKKEAINEPPSSVLDDSRRIKRAFDLGVRDALVEHKRLGNSVVEWRDGKAVLVPADEINPDAALGKA